MYQLTEIEAEVKKIANRIGANQYQIPTYGKNRDFGATHVEVDGSHYHLVTVERGMVLERKSTADFNELLYFIFSDATSDIACNFELKNRIEDQDPRRIMFKKQIELMYSINRSFGEREESRIAELLKTYPYDDELIRDMNRQRSGNAI